VRIVNGRALQGTAVVELGTGIAGGYATKLLADAGADVIVVEPPGGDPLRRWCASGTALGAGADGPLFRFLAAGKRSVTADPAVQADIEAVLDLVRGAAVVVWDERGPFAAVAALHPDALRVAAPGTVVVALSPFGLRGPWAGRPATEFTVQALSGGVAHRGPADRPPLAIGGRHGEWVLGAFATVGMLVGLFRRGSTGTGELVDASMLEALVMTPHFNAITYQSIAGQPYFIGRRPRYPADIEPTADGYVGFALVNTLQPWLDFCALIGHPEWAEDAELQNPTLRAGRYDEVIGEIQAWTAAHTTEEIVEVASAMRIPVAPVGNGANVAAMDHFVERGFFQRSADGTMVQPSSPFRFESVLAEPVAPASPPPGPAVGSPGAPTIPAGAPAGAAAGPAAPAADASLPLAGLRVADLTAFWAGPFASHPLAMLGAEVIHVESAARMDGARAITVRTADPARWWEWSHAFQGVNTNKLGAALDLSSEAGREALRRIIARCDVVIENYSPRVMEAWGLDAAALREIRPDLVVVRMPAFGLAGPWRDRVGFAMTMEQVSGLAWVTGYADGPPVTLLGPCDPVGAAHGTIAVLLALLQRRRDGGGVMVEVPMVAGALNMAAEQVLEHSAHGVLLGRDGNRGPAAAPQNLYVCNDDPPEGHDARRVAIAVADDAQWQALRAALGDPAWAADPALDHHQGRRVAHDRIDGHLAAWCAARSAAEVVECLWPAGVPVAPVLTNGELATIEQLSARRFLEAVDHPVTGRSLHTTYPVQLSAGPDRWHRRPAPLLGQHTHDVLRRIAGLSETEIDALDAAGVTRATIDPDLKVSRP